MKSTLSHWLVAAVLLTATLPATGVTFGQADGTSHPFVGTILLKSPEGYFGCSGTLLSSTVLLTAAHCTSSAGEVNERTWVTFAPEISLAGIDTYPSVDAFFDDPANGWISGVPHPHPDFADFAQFPMTFDIGVVVLDQPVVLSTYGTLPTPNFLDTIRKSADNSFTVVGYGVQGVLKPFASDTWARYNGLVKLKTVHSTSNAGHSAMFSNSPGTGGGACFGDSGGPVLYKDTTIVTAVVSWGRTPCIGVDYNFRVDIQTALDFVTPFLGP